MPAIFDDAYRWGARVLLHMVSGPFGVIRDSVALLRHKASRSRPTLRSTAGLLLVPLLGTTLFIALFAVANPVIAQVLGAVEAPSPIRYLIWIGVAATVWPAFRPRALAVRVGFELPEPDMRLPGTSLPSVVIALILFNAAFAVQNALDVAFLWSGAPLPDGVTLADYAHNGAYPLIVTALLAGAFVLLTLRQGSAAAGSPLVRRLVVLWVAQNLLLVASSVLRTIDYIEVYQLTAWRISALVWMALVGLGLILICWRALSGYSARWLINSNALAAALVLITACFVDLQAIAANWNVRHGREGGGTGAPIDLCYLREIGSPSLLPLIALEQHRLTPGFRDRVRFVRQQIYNDLVAQQRDWNLWTPRDSRRLARAQLQLGRNPSQPLPVAAHQYRGCDGSVRTAVTEPIEILPDPTRPKGAATVNVTSEDGPPTKAEMAPLEEDGVAAAALASPGNHQDLTRGAAR